MGVLSQLEPKGVFGFFETICSIPHGSGNTDAIAEYRASFAAERGFECSRDEANNVLVTVPASAGRIYSIATPWPRGKREGWKRTMNLFAISSLKGVPSPH